MQVREKKVSNIRDSLRTGEHHPKCHTLTCQKAGLRLCCWTSRYPDSRVCQLECRRILNSLSPGEGTFPSPRGVSPAPTLCMGGCGRCLGGAQFQTWSHVQAAGRLALGLAAKPNQARSPLRKHRHLLVIRRGLRLVIALLPSSHRLSAA
jgi:hypothetical protein